jgi:GNAT superfamily N-acetyltransferase
MGKEIMNSLQKLINLEKATASIGFDWPNVDAIVDQAISECDEIRQSMRLQEGPQRLQEEVGDLIHACVSLCVFENLPIEKIIDSTTNKFRARLTALKQIMKERGYDTFQGQTFDHLLEIWHEAKIIAKEASKTSIIQVRPMEAKDITPVASLFTNIGWHKPPSLFEGYLQDQKENTRLVWVATLGKDLAGYVTLKWQSSYEPFKNQSIPEVVDLNVIPFFHKQGVGTRLMDQAEEAAREYGDIVGIGVGLTPDYGQAQRLYINRGYIPDGRGITYNYEVLNETQHLSIDDNLVLWLTKNLG